MRAQPTRARAAHRRVDAIRTRLVARGEDDAHPDDHRPPAQLRPVPLLDRREERVEVGVEDRRFPHANICSHTLGSGLAQAARGERSNLRDPLVVGVDVHDAEAVMERGLRDQEVGDRGAMPEPVVMGEVVLEREPSFEDVGRPRPAGACPGARRRSRDLVGGPPQGLLDRRPGRSDAQGGLGPLEQVRGTASIRGRLAARRRPGCRGRRR